jgi:hypothetical protein
MHVGLLITCYRPEKGQKKRKGKAINQNRRVTSVIEKEHVNRTKTLAVY